MFIISLLAFTRSIYTVFLHITEQWLKWNDWWQQLQFYAWHTSSSWQKLQTYPTGMTFTLENQFYEFKCNMLKLWAICSLLYVFKPHAFMVLGLFIKFWISTFLLPFSPSSNNILSAIKKYEMGKTKGGTQKRNSILIGKQWNRSRYENNIKMDLGETDCVAEILIKVSHDEVQWL